MIKGLKLAGIKPTLSPNLESKSDCREYVRSQRAKKTHNYLADKLISRQLLKLIDSYRPPRAYRFTQNGRLFFMRARKPRRLLVYIPLEGEANIWGVINHLRKRKSSKGYDLLVPKTSLEARGAGFRVVKFCLPLIKTKFRLKEPLSRALESIKHIDLAVIPVLAVDKNLKRIGFGKGMYDRFFASLKARPFSIFVSKKRYISPRPLCEAHDIGADIYVSSRA